MNKELTTRKECYEAYLEFCKKETVSKEELFEALDRVKIQGAELFHQRSALVSKYMAANGIPEMVDDIRYNTGALLGLMNEWKESRMNK